ncbi:hypothetical protein NDU88_000866 [Pleurodeles waltl]|uniref:Uncharacterized protein n=1 Tax=Pleurodeles waltl TaxID=8319 RepID=A0AAV7L7W7_PLEWA|nr:hypothetical protein NDU88_000866 [Pleurodeles waltl]
MPAKHCNYPQLKTRKEVMWRENVDVELSLGRRSARGASVSRMANVAKRTWILSRYLKSPGAMVFRTKNRGAFHPLFIWSGIQAKGTGTQEKAESHVEFIYSSVHISVVDRLSAGVCLNGKAKDIVLEHLLKSKCVSYIFICTTSNET